MTGTRAETVETAASGKLEALCVEHARAALRFAFYLCGEREQARDLVQDAFVRVAGRFSYLRKPDVFGTYLRRTDPQPAHVSPSARAARARLPCPGGLHAGRHP
jgi:hypothetical protein